ncbi:MAG: LysR substrate-binding domain-containing protein [Archangium sp.]
MELKHLRVFVALSETLHFGKAAARLRLGQPAVSQLLKTLETELGVELVRRTRRSVELTVAGHQFLGSARRSIDAAEEAVLAARHAGAGEFGSISLGLNVMSAMSKLPAVISRYRKRFPRVLLRMTAGGTEPLLESVRTGRVDVAFTIIPGDVAPLETLPLTLEPLCLVVPTHHRLAKARWAAPRQFIAEPFIQMPRADEPNVHRGYESMCVANGTTPHVVAETQQIETAFAFVAAGLGLTLLPASAKRLRFPGISFVEMRPRVEVGMLAVWDPARLTETGRQFLALLREAV